MNNIRKSLEILFNYQNPQEILNNYFSAKNNYLFSEKIDKEHFRNIFSYNYKELYNKDEINNVVNLIENKWNKNLYIKDNNIFNMILKFAKDVLIEENGEPLCDYEHLLRWREISFQLGEDIFTTAFFANKDYEAGRERTKFAWRPIVATNNVRIRELLKRGLAENHFHLKGSAPHFQISWISLMNNLKVKTEGFRYLKKERRLNPEINIGFEEENIELEFLIDKAIAIRLYLFEKYILKLPQEAIEEISDCIKKILKSKNREEIIYYREKLQTEIELLKHLEGKRIDKEIPDYLIPKNITLNNQNKNYNGNLLLYGERYFLYTILKGIYSGEKDLKYEKELLYVYILIKQRFRAEMLQINGKIGFGNFGEYQDRKSFFILPNSIYEKAIINMAIAGSMSNQNIKVLEARIAPSNSVKEYSNNIRWYDKFAKIEEFSDKDVEKFLKTEKVCEKCIENFLENRIKKEENYFYNVHFIKMREDILSNKKEYLALYPRNYKIRERIKKQALELNNFRKSGYKHAKRILGIDAANVEIGCRPEVFGQVYRYFKNYSYENPLNKFDIDNFQTFGFSYHVGEEFLDLVDGLRAIEEAILFLNFSYGDRLGHTLALGIEPYKYYEGKEYTIAAIKQDILDNIVWILAKIREYNIETTISFINKLENEYRKYYIDIYGKKQIRESIYEDCTHFDYYDSWKLRGDAPELYRDIKKEYEEKVAYSFLEKCRENQIEIVKEARRNRKAIHLYKAYHYDEEAKLNGAIAEEFKIDKDYIEVVKKIQKNLQRVIARKNIFIETNPSSNYLIGTIKRYNEHPIFNFYNLGLEKIDLNHQISVSINTDDQGIFSTYLENEYALIALALEKYKDNNGDYMYNQTMIYEWLDKIRQMGMEQSFINKMTK